MSGSTTSHRSPWQITFASRRVRISARATTTGRVKPLTLLFGRSQWRREPGSVRNPLSGREREFRRARFSLQEAWQTARSTVTRSTEATRQQLLDKGELGLLIWIEEYRPKEFAMQA